MVCSSLNRSFSLLVAAVVSIPALASVPLVPGAAPVALPGSTAAAEPDLAGTVLQDNLTPFRIFGAGGALLFEGKLQSRVVRSNATGKVHLAYRIRDTRPGLNGIVASLFARTFSSSPRTLADWRPDGLGIVHPLQAQRSAGPGAIVRFDFDTVNDVLVGGRDSKFFYVKTMNATFNGNGQVRITLTGGESVTLAALQPQP